MRDAARLGDGWFPYYVARDRFASWVPELRNLRRDEGLDPDAFTVLGGPTVSVQADPAKAKKTVAANVAWYVAAMGDVYANSLRKQGYADAVEAVIAANPKSVPGGMVVPPEAEVLLEQLTAYGSPGDVAAGLAAWDSAVDVNMLGLVPGTPWDEIEAILKAGAPTRVDT
ncbi:MAG: LLM class flavin-dependent oxidoreductase [Minwuia sp.]|uniref:LLM class flavin-dependent oxidoreductase n=1 Tax=Minwuia sp. TaxID=2493630 RepID=UPI003A86E861